MNEYVVVFVAVSSAHEGKTIARSLVEEKLAACVNVLPGMASHYRWKGKLESAREQLLLIKTSRSKFPALKKHVRKIHSYETPEIIALPIVDGCRDYLSWIGESLKP